jgi:alanyl-tRNA synthetase
MHVNNRRRDIAANHTATHLLNLALRQALGDHVEQRGSLVDEHKTRFDFTHGKALDHDELAKVERRVNAMICENLPVRSNLLPLDQAKALNGVRAVFGEKYPDPVRVVYALPGDLEDCDGREQSVEFCGGTHVARTGDIGFFKVVAEESVSKGIRRLTAVTGCEAVAVAQRAEKDLKDIAQTLAAPVEEASARVSALRKEVRELKKKLAAGGGGSVDAVAEVAKLLESAPVHAGVKVVVAEIKDSSDEQLRRAIDSAKAQREVAVLLATAGPEKVGFAAGVSDTVIKKGLKAGDWVREAAKAAGGGGGGRPNFAVAGAKDTGKLPAALEAARSFAGDALS